MISQRSIIALFLLAVFSGVQAQVRFEVKVSKNSLGLNERLRVDFEINEDGDNFTPPDFSGFRIVGGPNQSVSYQWVNGEKSYLKTYSYFLSPKKKGNFKIGQASIHIKGNVYKTIPVAITVTTAIDKPKDPNDPNYLVDKAIHLVADVSNSNPYLNEAITVVYKLYVAQNIGISNWREIDIPRYSDFWSQNIEVKGLKVYNDTYNGEDYRYIILRKTVLYPQKAGKLEINPLSLDITAEVPTNRRDFFGGRMMKQIHHRVSAGSKVIRVKSLPEEGRPANFGGAVGQFNFEVKTSKKALNATESLQANVSVSGKGNLKLFELPKLNVPSSLEVYDPEKNDQIQTSNSGMRGRRTETYTIVPQYKGKFPIPSISFSYFNPKTERYVNLSSKQITIDVLSGPRNLSISEDQTTLQGEKNALGSANQFAYIKTGTDLMPKQNNHFFLSKSYWSGILVPLLIIPVVVFARRQKRLREADLIGSRARQANRLARRFLGEAKKSIKQEVVFYLVLEKALHNYLKAKLQIETSEFSKEKIIALLKGKSVDVQNIDNFIKILERCELARYTPSSDTSMKQDYQNALDCIAALDKQIGNG